MNAHQWMQTLDTLLAHSDLAAVEVLLEFDAQYPEPDDRNRFLVRLERDRAAVMDAAAREFGASGRLPRMDAVNAFQFRRRAMEARRATEWWMTTPGADADADAPQSAWAETWLIEWWRDAGQVRWASVLLGLGGPPPPA